MAKLYVGNLPYQTTGEDLRTLFEQYGSVESADVVTDRETGRSRGFGFVEMPDSGEANEAVEALHGHPFGGRDLTVNEARPRAPREGGGGGGYRGGGGGGRGGYGGDRGGRGGGGSNW